MNPVTHLGIRYPSQRALARALGVSDQAIVIALERGTLDRVGSGRRWNNASPFDLEGIHYHSIAEYARLHGITPSQARYRLRKLRCQATT